LFYLSQSIQNNNNLAIAAESSEKTVSIMAVGDSIGYKIKHEKLSNLHNIIHNNTDIFIFNLEGVLAADSSFLDNSNSIEECKGFTFLSVYFCNRIYICRLSQISSNNNSKLG
jgi:hypothetical protein